MTIHDTAQAFIEEQENKAITVKCSHCGCSHLIYPNQWQCVFKCTSCGACIVVPSAKSNYASSMQTVFFVHSEDGSGSQICAFSTRQKALRWINRIIEDIAPLDIWTKHDENHYSYHNAHLRIHEQNIDQYANREDDTTT
jgi:ribosomal protein S27E